MARVVFYSKEDLATNVPVKEKVIFKPLPSVKSKMNFTTVKIGFNVNDVGSYEFSPFELTNLNVDWK